MVAMTKPSRRFFRNPAAFGLVEIAISLGVVSFALLALVGLAVVGLNSSRAAQEDTVVASLARNAVSELRSLGYAQLSALSSTNFYYTYDGARASGPEGEAYYECQARFRPPSGGEPLRHVVLEFSWPCQGSKNNGVSFSTSLAEF